MKYGVILPSYGPDANRLSNIDTAHAAESLGYDSIWATDHIALPEADAGNFGTIFEAISLISYLAGVTSQIKLGISALVLPQRNPVEVAKSLATLDVLSGGRIILTTGIGWSSGEYFNLGKNFENRGKRMDESIKVIKALWSGREVVSFKGDYYQFNDAVLSPKPLQRNGPLIWVAGNSQPAIQRAIKLGDGWHPTIKQPAVFAREMEQIRNQIGNRMFTVAMRINLPLSDSFTSEYEDKNTNDIILELMKAYQLAGLDYVMIDFDAKDQQDREKKMKSFMEEIVPEIV